MTIISCLYKRKQYNKKHNKKSIQSTMSSNKKIFLIILIKICFREISLHCTIHNSIKGVSVSVGHKPLTTTLVRCASRCSQWFLLGSSVRWATDFIYSRECAHLFKIFKEKRPSQYKLNWKEKQSQFNVESFGIQ